MNNSIAISEKNIEQLSLFNIKKEALNTPNYTNDTILLKKDYLSFKQKYGSVRKEEKTSSIEEFNDIPSLEGRYQISNFGNVKSLLRNRERILSSSFDKSSGYFRIRLSLNRKRKSYYIHQLVAMAFLGHIPNGNLLVVDHIDNDKTNNELDNLQVITNRENLSKDKWRYNPSSLYTGVCFNMAKKKWESSISVQGVSFHLGYFNNEVNAALEYKKALKHNNEYSGLTNYSFKTKRRISISNDLNQVTIDFSYN